MKQTNRKGFTIVELVIVIAVIAILAAVLIPTFASLINKANRSADIQAVHQMNTLLATYTDGSVKTVSDAVKALDAENIDLEDYKALQSNHYFYFVLNDNTPMVIYATYENGKDVIVYPENLDESKLGQWMSLSGMVPTNSDYTITGGKVTIDSGAKLAHLIDAKKNTSEALEITLSGNVDLKGAAVDFGKTTADITITGGTLSGLRADNNSVRPTTGEFAGHSYGFGIFGDIESGTVKLKNVTISGLNVGNSLATHGSGANTIGLVAGYIKKGATVELNNVTFKDCVVNGYQKVGGIVGQLHGTLNMTNVKFENVSVNGVVEVAKVAGIVGDKGSLTTNSCEFEGIKMGVHSNTDIYGTFTKSEVGNSLIGDEDNTYGYWRDWHGSSSTSSDSYRKNVLIFGIVTNDLAWYYVASTDATEDITVKGSQYSLNGWVNSTSKNITNGTPAN